MTRRSTDCKKHQYHYKVNMPKCLLGSWGGGRGWRQEGTSPFGSASRSGSFRVSNARYSFWGGVYVCEQYSHVPSSLLCSPTMGASRPITAVVLVDDGGITAHRRCRARRRWGHISIVTHYLRLLMYLSATFSHLRHLSSDK